jgi:hypothetical protein
MLDRMDLESRERGILARPLIDVDHFTITHELEDVTYTDVADATTDMSDPDELLTSNYVEFRNNINLRDILYNSCVGGYDLDIQADVGLSYSDTFRQAVQFPTRDSSNNNSSDIGTIIGAASCISSVASTAAYSNTYQEDWDNTAYYVTINTNAILTLNSDDALNEYGDYYQLGINELEMDADGLALDENGNSIIKLNASYNVSDLSEAETAESMKVVVSLRKKADYNTKLQIDDYITDLKLFDVDDKSFAESDYASYITSSEVTDAEEYTYIIQDPDQYLHYDSVGKTYQIPITFSALSGSNFDGQYSNYMIKMEVEMYTDTSATPANIINGSRDDDHVIWTHSKILYEVIEP